MIIVAIAKPGHSFHRHIVAIVVIVVAMVV